MRIGPLEIRVAPSGLSPVPTNRGGWLPWVREPYAGAWQRNQEWTTDTVAAHHAVYACITRIAQDFGKLRSMLIERKDKIGKEITNTSHSPVLRRPNRYQNENQFKEWWATCKLFHGNAYALLERDGREVPSSMYLLDPTRVQVLVSTDGEVFYKLKQDNISGLTEDERIVPASEIIHDRINCIFHPLVGTSPIFACGTAANMGLEIQKNSSTFFGNGSTPTGILSSPLEINAVKADEYRTRWEQMFGKNGPGGIAVLGSAMKFEAMRMTATDSQLIEQLHWTAETVCSTFHVPSWKIGIGEQPAYTKPEIANQAYYSDCLQAHIEQFEACMNGAFGFETPTEGRMLSVELDLSGLLRMDAASQMDLLVKASGGAVLTPDEARERVDLGPLPGGNTLYRQEQEHSLEALSKRDEKPDPFSSAAPSSGHPPQTSQNQPDTQDTAPADETRSWADWLTSDALETETRSLALTGT